VNGPDLARAGDRVCSDPRAHYLIFQRRIANPGRTAGGNALRQTDPHENHLHLSIYADRRRPEVEPRGRRHPASQPSHLRRWRGSPLDPPATLRPDHGDQRRRRSRWRLLAPLPRTPWRAW
jgi:hypothetical protein